MTTRTHLLLTAATATAAFSLAACDSGDDTTGEPSTLVSTNAQLPAPVIITPDELDGQNITISVDRPLVISVPNHPERWTIGAVDDHTIAQFTPGRDDGSATYNPGFTARNQGETTAHITDPATDTTITFTLTIS